MAASSRGEAWHTLGPEEERVDASIDARQGLNNSDPFFLQILQKGELSWMRDRMETLPRLLGNWESPYGTDIDLIRRDYDKYYKGKGGDASLMCQMARLLTWGEIEDALLSLGKDADAFFTKRGEGKGSAPQVPYAVRGGVIYGRNPAPAVFDPAHQWGVHTDGGMEVMACCGRKLGSPGCWIPLSEGAYGVVLPYHVWYHKLDALLEKLKDDSAYDVADFVKNGTQTGTAFLNRPRFETLDRDIRNLVESFAGVAKTVYSTLEDEVDSPDAGVREPYDMLSMENRLSLEQLVRLVDEFNRPQMQCSRPPDDMRYFINVRVFGFDRLALYFNEDTLNFVKIGEMRVPLLRPSQLDPDEIGRLIVELRETTTPISEESKSDLLNKLARAIGEYRDELEGQKEESGIAARIEKISIDVRKLFGNNAACENYVKITKQNALRLGEFKTELVQAQRRVNTAIKSSVRRGDREITIPGVNLQPFVLQTLDEPPFLADMEEYQRCVDHKPLTQGELEEYVKEKNIGEGQAWVLAGKFESLPAIGEEIAFINETKQNSVLFELVSEEIRRIEILLKEIQYLYDRISLIARSDAKFDKLLISPKAREIFQSTKPSVREIENKLVGKLEEYEAARLKLDDAREQALLNVEVRRGETRQRKEEARQREAEEEQRRREEARKAEERSRRETQRRAEEQEKARQAEELRKQEEEARQRRKEEAEAEERNRRETQRRAEEQEKARQVEERRKQEEEARQRREEEAEAARRQKEATTPVALSREVIDYAANASMLVPQPPNGLITSKNFSWEGNSCAFDSLFTAVFKIPGLWLQRQIFDAKEVMPIIRDEFTQNSINSIHHWMIDDILFLTDSVDRGESPRICVAADFWAKIFKTPITNNKTNDPVPMLIDLLKFYRLENYYSLLRAITTNMNDIEDFPGSASPEMIIIETDPTVNRNRKIQNFFETRGAYTLISAITYSTEKGHWASYVKDPRTKEWWHFDAIIRVDDSLRRVQEGGVPLGVTLAQLSASEGPLRVRGESENGLPLALVQLNDTFFPKAWIYVRTAQLEPLARTLMDDLIDALSTQAPDQTRIRDALNELQDSERDLALAKLYQENIISPEQYIDYVLGVETDPERLTILAAVLPEKYLVAIKELMQ